MTLESSPLPNNPTPPMPIQPDMSGYKAGPGNTGNPVLDEISAAHANLSPQAQQAIEGAHGMLGISPSHSDPALAASTAPSPEVAVPGVPARGSGYPGAIPASASDPDTIVNDKGETLYKVPLDQPLHSGSPAPSPEVAVPGVSGPRGPLPILSPEIPAPARPMSGSTGGTPMADGGGSGVDSALPAALSGSVPGVSVTPPAPQSAAQAELQRRQATGSGVHQFAQNHKWLGVPLEIADAVGSGFFPRIAQFIPGTSAKHVLQDVPQSERQVADEASQQKNAADVAHVGAETGLENAQTAGVPAESALKQAETQNYISEAEARKNPDLQVVGHPVIDPSDESKTPRTGYFNKKTGTMTYGPEVAAAPVAESNKPTVEKMDNGDVVAVHYDPATKKSSMEVVYHGDPKVETDIAKLEVNGKPHSVVVNKKTGETIKDLGETGEKPPTVNVNQGTWAIEEDADGKPIEYNSKTGETRAVAPGGVQKSGTKAKGDAAKQPAKDALNYAETYLQAPAHTGSGDEALQEKFFELAKPTTGFRMTQPQMDMLQNSRSWMGSVAAHLRHATTGTWFNDEQRGQIVQTMRDLAKAKGVEGTAAQSIGATTQFKEGDQQVKDGVTYVRDKSGNWNPK